MPKTPLPMRRRDRRKEKEGESTANEEAQTGWGGWDLGGVRTQEGSQKGDTLQNAEE